MQVACKLSSRFLRVLLLLSRAFKPCGLLKLLPMISSR
jgi:hypothetical protein